MRLKILFLFLSPLNDLEQSAPFFSSTENARTENEGLSQSCNNKTEERGTNFTACHKHALTSS